MQPESASGNQREMILKVPIFKKAENYRKTYVNMLRITNTIVDFRIDCANIEPPLEDSENLEALMDTTIILSPVEAKLLLNLLRNQIQQYEDNIGPILDLSDMESYKKASGG